MFERSRGDGIVVPNADRVGSSMLGPRRAVTTAAAAALDPPTRGSASRPAWTSRAWREVGVDLSQNRAEARRLLLRRTPAASRSSTPTSRSRATTPSSATSTASRSTTSPTRTTRHWSTAVVCPGGQGEVSVYGNLLFMSAEETRARTDCGAPGVPTGEPTRFRGVRIFDISNIAAPAQVATVQTCRGSHTHTLLKSPSDDANLYVYVSARGRPLRRPSSRASARCESARGSTPQFDEGLSHLAGRGDQGPAGGAAERRGRQRPAPVPALTDRGSTASERRPDPQHPSGPNWSPTPSTDSCHDLTTYPELGIAAGACEGNGILIDISDPANPVRIDEVAGPPFAYWHGATFSNDGKKVVFTDEWGGGTAALPRDRRRSSWGANAIYDIVGGQFVFRSLRQDAGGADEPGELRLAPAVARPVPGRDIITQAWYQAGASVIDFTDSANPKEIGYYDRGPISGTRPRARRPLVVLLLQRRRSSAARSPAASTSGS